MGRSTTAAVGRRLRNSRRGRPDGRASRSRAERDPRDVPSHCRELATGGSPRSVGKSRNPHDDDIRSAPLVGRAPAKPCFATSRAVRRAGDRRGLAAGPPTWLARRTGTHHLACFNRWSFAVLLPRCLNQVFFSTVARCTTAVLSFHSGAAFRLTFAGPLSTSPSGRNREP